MNAEQIIYMKIREIVLHNKRPFTYRDLKLINVNGVSHSYSSGTIRNICYKLRKEGKIVLVRRSSQAYYTIKGIKFENPVTFDYTGVVINKQVQDYIKIFKIHELDDPAIHNIRLNFSLDILAEILQSNRSNFIDHFDKSNMNTVLKDICSDNIIIKTMIHNSGNVSVIVACTDNPITFDMHGLSRLVRGLSRLEERLRGEVALYYHNHPSLLPSLTSSSSVFNNIVTDDGDTVCTVLKPRDNEDNVVSIPHLNTWIISMWHFGQDSKELDFDGSRFNIAFKDGIDLFRVYSKKRKVKKSM